jgi:hypothetical protein
VIDGAQYMHVSEKTPAPGLPIASHKARGFVHIPPADAMISVSLSIELALCLQTRP